MTTELSGLVAAAKACTAACVITLTPGTYPSPPLSNLNLPPGQVTFDLTGSTFDFAVIGSSSGFTVVGGTVVKGNKWGFCWVIDHATGITLKNNVADQCPTAAFVLTRSKDITLTDWTVTAPGCDGVQVAGMNGFVVTRGNYSGYVPNPNGCHADGVQMWAMAGFPLVNGVVSDNTITSTSALTADGKSRGVQGIDDYGGTPDPKDNISVIDNTLSLYGSVCVGMVNVTHLTVRGNKCTNNQPQPWKSRYIWTNSSGKIGPNQLDGKVLRGSETTSP